jgi:hypothetical protein
MYVANHQVLGRRCESYGSTSFYWGD